ncbi:MAG: hypothetical protein ACFB0G_07965 [Leptolyngbyaceae cyanobacterium]
MLILKSALKAEAISEEGGSGSYCHWSGEAIGWHLQQAIRPKNIQRDVKSKLSESNVE